MTDFVAPQMDAPAGDRGPDLATLLEQSAGGDEQAFAVFYDATASRVYGLAVRVLNDQALAVEVTQEVYRQLWTDSSRFDPSRGSAISWILTTVHHRAVRRVRGSGSRASASGTGEGATAALAPPEREAVELAYFDGHTHAEVARLSGVTPGIVQSRIRDGLLTLRDR